MTICAKCGEPRRHIDAACPKCRFRPTLRRDLAVAAILTSQFDCGDSSCGTPPSQLERLSQAIRNGEAIALDDVEIERHDRLIESFLDIKASHVYWFLFRTCLPGILFVAGACGLLAFLRATNR